MPTRLNRALVDMWPSWPGVHPRYLSGFTLAILLGWLVFGLVLAGGAVSDDWVVAVALRGATWQFEVAVGLWISAGAACSLAGALCRPKLVSTRWAWDSFGLPLAASGWLAYGLTTVIPPPHAPGWLILSMSFAAAALIRLWSILRHAKRTREAVRSA